MKPAAIRWPHRPEPLVSRTEKLPSLGELFRKTDQVKRAKLSAPTLLTQHEITPSVERDFIRRLPGLQLVGVGLAVLIVEHQLSIGSYSPTAVDTIGSRPDPFMDRLDMSERETNVLLAKR